LIRDKTGADAGACLCGTATARARALGQRAVLDVGHSLVGLIALYESEGWTRVDAIRLALGDKVMDLLVYVSPEEPA
jgi:hypothetical protein